MRTPYYVVTDDSRPAPLGIKTVNLDEIHKCEFEHVAFWLIDMHNQRLGWDLLSKIRHDVFPAVYLRPVIFWLGGEELHSDILDAAEGNIYASMLTEAVITEWAEKLQPINQWIDRLPDANTGGDTNIAFRVLRILASGRKELAPVTTTRRNSGYVYPVLDPLYGIRDASVLETLSFLESQKLVSGRFISKAHYCSQCDSAFLNFIEACPDCKSQHINGEELIHHFKCAHTAEISDFKHDDTLVCPKCDQSLHHIGVDYDKPSVVYRCNDCNHVFQDPLVLSSCYHCGWTIEPEHQVHRSIYSYTMTALGQNAALYGMDALFSSILDSKLRLHSLTDFKQFFDIEAARIQRYKLSTSSLVMIRLKDLDTVYIRLGKRAKDVFIELSAVFRAVLRRSDVITARNETIFFVIMTETSNENAHRAVERLEEGITALLENNLELTPDVISLIKNIDADMDLDATLEEFLRKYGD
ncbi:hypothetical protein ACFL2V_02380 [Pseudomonadota bacterium]